jgi:hypothetical protein
VKAKLAFILISFAKGTVMIQDQRKKDFTPMLDHYLTQLGENTKTPTREITPFSWPGRTVYKYQASLDMGYMCKKFPQLLRTEKNDDGHCMYYLTPQGAIRKSLLAAGAPSSEMAMGPLRTAQDRGKKDFTLMLNHYLVQLTRNTGTLAREVTMFGPTTSKGDYQKSLDIANMGRRFPELIRMEKDVAGNWRYFLTPKGEERKQNLLGKKALPSLATAPQTSGLRIVATTPEASLSHMDAHYRTLFRTLQELPKGSEVAVVFYKV